jgi:hypothetical protein
MLHSYVILVLPNLTKIKLSMDAYMVFYKEEWQWNATLSDARNSLGESLCQKAGIESLGLKEGFYEFA